jgi:hypothetical protein
VGAFLALILVTCLLTAMLALFCSVFFRKTAHSLMTTYLVIIALFTVPLALNFFAQTFFPNDPATELVAWTRMTSPFAAAFDVPLSANMPDETPMGAGTWSTFAGYMTFAIVTNGTLLASMIWLFNTRWRVAQ